MVLMISAETLDTSVLGSRTFSRTMCGCEDTVCIEGVRLYYVLVGRRGFGFELSCAAVFEYLKPSASRSAELNAMPLSSGQARFPFVDVLERDGAA
jgi:hypothetical protein